jgi:DNA polymerase epsilon subunit 4
LQEIPIIAKDATFLISVATEEFIKRLCEAARANALKEKRATVQQKDLGPLFTNVMLSSDLHISFSAAVVRRADEFLFLEGGIGCFTLSEG